MNTISKRSCDFCGKTHDAVKRLIIGNHTSICNECIDLCVTILEDEEVVDKKEESILDKDKLNPEKIKEHLDKYIISQEDAKIALSVAVANHYKRIRMPPKDLTLDKSNIMIVGPSGSGKTLIARAIADYLDVPFVITDATTLTEAGYVGDDVESIIGRLLHVADGDVKKAENGIIFIDEIDKTARKSENVSITRDVSGEGVQQALLKLVEGTECRISPQSSNRKHPSHEMVTINTTNILFIVSGAFVGLDDMIMKRKTPTSMGFNATINEKKNDKSYILKEVEPYDFVEYGLIPEFTGRFPILTHVKHLTVDDMVSILVNTKNNIIDQYRYYFSLHDIDLEFTQESLYAIAKKANSLTTGARGLKKIIEDILMMHQFKLNRYESNGVKKIIVSDDTVCYNENVQFVYDVSKKVNQRL